MKKVRVGVTLHVRDGAQSIWENGAFQNVVFLARLLQNSPVVGEVAIVTNRDSSVELHGDMMLAGLCIPIITRLRALETVDVLIELGATFDDEWCEAFRRKGGRIISMRVGNDYVIDAERAMFSLPHSGLCSRRKVDMVWTLAEFEHSCSDYFRLTTRASVRVMPHLWMPYFLQQGLQALPDGVEFGYRPGRRRWRFASAEPNICMVKTALVPLMICEGVYRQRPAAAESVTVFNALTLQTNQPFMMMTEMLDISRHGLLRLEGRQPLYQILASSIDAVVSHQWENAQNYLYYEVLWGGYPLIHNSPYLRDLGYFYEGFDCEEGVNVTAKALEQHDTNLKQYREKAAEFLQGLGVDLPTNVEVYTRGLVEVLSSTA